MRRFTFSLLLLALAAGCGKKPAPAPTDSGEKGEAPSADTTASDRTKLLNTLKSSNLKARRDAADQLAGWAETDPEAVAGLIELLREKTTNGLGKTNPSQISSTREAAAMALLWAGPRGEAALKEKGLAVLREGLNDPQPAIREHTAYTIGLLGPLARPLSPDVMKLCTNPDPNIHGRAFDTLRSIGITDVPGFVTLLTSENPEIANLAAELVSGIPDIPPAAIPPLTVALASPERMVRIAAAEGLATAGPKAAAAAGAVSEAIKKSYAAEYDPKTSFDAGSELAFWRALSRIGEASVNPATELLNHSNPVVRAYAAQTLGEIGPPAKPAAGKLEEVLKDMYGDVAIEAACALCRIGERTEAAVELVKRAIDAPNAVAQTAIASIPRMGEAGKPLIPLALAKLSSDNPYARYAAIGLVGTLPAPEATKSAEELAKLATDSYPAIRYRVGAVLEKLGPAGSPAAATLGTALLNESDEGIRDQFVDAIIAMKQGARPALASLLKLAARSSQPVQRQVKVLSALVVADPSSKEVMAALLAAAGDPDQTLRIAAARELGTLDPLPHEALDRLVKLARSDSMYNPQVAAVRAVAAAGPKAKAAKGDLEAIAAGPKPGLALWAKVALASIDGNIARSASAVRTGLTDRVPATRASAAEALLMIGPATSDLPVLMKLVKDVGAGTREAAVKCIGRLGPKAREAVPQLIAALNDRESDVRLAAVEALGEMGPAAAPAIEKLKDLRREPLLESAAARTLDRLGVKDARQGVKK
jgi:HEAT repeat protein